MKYVYRYVDHNRPGDGHAEVVLQRRVIIKETEHYVWHVPHPGTWNGLPQTMNPDAWYWEKWQSKGRQGYYPKKNKKGGKRSAWHLTEKEALAAWAIRKSNQLAILRLQMERVKLCIDAAYRDGVIIPNVVNANGYRQVIDRIVSTPDVIYGGIGDEIESYCWTEY